MSGAETSSYTPLRSVDDQPETKRAKVSDVSDGFTSPRELDTATFGSEAEKQPPDNTTDNDWGYGDDIGDGAEFGYDEVGDPNTYAQEQSIVDGNDGNVDWADNDDSNEYLGEEATEASNTDNLEEQVEEEEA